MIKEINNIKVDDIIKYVEEFTMFSNLALHCMDTKHVSYPAYPHTQEIFAAEYAIKCKHAYDRLTSQLILMSGG